MVKKASICLSLIVMWTGACAHRPIDEMALADTALKAAQKVKADALAPDFYRRAENYYLRAKRDYTDGYYDSAKKMATESRLSAEQAEYRALAKQNQTKARPADEGPGGAPDALGAPPPPPPPDGFR